ncbi:hypothetical protein [Pararhizobium sp. IMCC21322]|uniref:hypothetical protein n=1 Tax=Pararhizobium sp. IMCC21322 TaxID=3067903 RepID=UPI002742254B|nr:hypothetical protein [Pararhizobium sp. IMCC21322]
MGFINAIADNVCHDLNGNFAEQNDFFIASSLPQPELLSICEQHATAPQRQSCLSDTKKVA